MNIKKERLDILRALCHENESSLIYDPSLKGILRETIAKIESQKDDHKIGELLDTLKSLYNDNGPPMIRCLLEYSYLFHSTSDIKLMFETLIKNFIKDLKTNDFWVTPTINELNKYAYSQYDTTQKLIGFIIESGGSVKKFYSGILSNPQAPFAIRIETARQIVVQKDSNDYPALINFVKEICESKHADDFKSKMLPAIDILSETGAIILNEVIYSFLKEIHGPLVIASFGDYFHTWFKENKLKIIPPDRYWVKVLSLAWNRSKSQENRDLMLSTMINDWSINSELAAIVRKHLSDKFREKPAYFEPAGSRIKELAIEFVDHKPSITLKDLTSDILKFSLKSEEDWKQFINSLPKDRLIGWGFARAYENANEAQQARFFDFLFTNVNKKLLSAFFTIFFQEGKFVKLTPESQMKIITIKNASYYIKIEELTPLIKSISLFSPAVGESLKKLYNEIIKTQEGYQQLKGKKIGGLE